MITSPFGPAADRPRGEDHDLPAQTLKKLKAAQELVEDLRGLVEAGEKEAVRLRRALEREREARRAAESRLAQAREAVAAELRRRAPAPGPGLLEPPAQPPPPPDLAELRRRLEDSEAERATLAAMVAESEAERDAALRARDATIARLQPRQEGEETSDARALKTRLEATTFEGVLGRAGRFCPSLVITADPDEARKLEHHQKAAQWRGRLADTLATMQMYAEAKNLARARGGNCGPELANFRAYCASQPSPLLSDKKVALNEGQLASTSPRGRAERTFRVPRQIASSGTAVMVEHIRIGDGSPPAPRLHFLDDTDSSGLIVIGFLGDHRYNASTN
ncbi:hypothetical protein [Streptomyces thermolilacinus]|uniref:hypothetical protein n=1 Tax=Streptomyces thermolilacinus TaxID=285540 RepID=UPI0003C73C42|nr:hypothetical protein [Streptomyces thermolilacinus]